MPNATMLKFGFPQTAIAETPQWSVQLRPQQPTLGSLVLVAKADAGSFADLPADAFVELRHVVSGVERILRTFVDYERINYLMLMMVDPDVHFHVIPRYSEVRTFEGVAFADAGWPGPPRLAEGVALGAETSHRLCERLRALWETP